MNFNKVELIIFLIFVLAPLLKAIGAGLKKLGQAGSAAAQRQQSAYQQKIQEIQRQRTEAPAARNRNDFDNEPEWDHERDLIDDRGEEWETVWEEEPKKEWPRPVVRFDDPNPVGEIGGIPVYTAPRRAAAPSRTATVTGGATAPISSATEISGSALSREPSTHAYDIATDAYASRTRAKRPAWLEGDLRLAARRGVIWQELLGKPVALRSQPPGHSI